MLIKPSPSEPVGRLLIPEARRAWMPSSQRITTSSLDHGIETRWSLTARLDDGHPLWRGWFDDRDDADAFLWAAANGTLLYERALWDLPGRLGRPDFAHLLDWDRPTYTGAWRPDLGEHLRYDLLSTLTVSSPTGSEQSVTIPASWSNTNNVIKAIGSGGPGGVRRVNGTRRGCGGGGAGYVYLDNHQVAVPGSTTREVFVGTDRTGPSQTSDGGQNGADNWSNSYMLGSDNSTKVLNANSGWGGKHGAFATVSGGAGGNGGIGTGGYTGGRGGNVTVATAGAMATGGGGAAGPTGNGGNGGDLSADGSTAGGSSGGTNAGAGGTGNRAEAGPATGGAGNDYGGGGGGCNGISGTITGGTGRQGIVWFEWTPNLRAGFNSPMMGM